MHTVICGNMVVLLQLSTNSWHGNNGNTVDGNMQTMATLLCHDGMACWSVQAALHLLLHH
jgi:hypothetical protein